MFKDLGITNWNVMVVKITHLQFGQIFAPNCLDKVFKKVIADCPQYVCCSCLSVSCSLSNNVQPKATTLCVPNYNVTRIIRSCGHTPMQFPIDWCESVVMEMHWGAIILVTSVCAIVTLLHDFLISLLNYNNADNHACGYNKAKIICAHLTLRILGAF